MANERIKFPLNHKAVVIANQRFWADHTGLNGRLLKASDSKELKDAWKEAYQKALREIEKPAAAAAPPPPPVEPPAAPMVVPCSKPAEFTNKVEDATAGQTEQIGKSHLGATKMIDCSLKRLKAAKDAPDPLAKQYFGINGTGADDQKKLDKLIANFEKIKKGMATAKYEVENEKIKPGEPYTVAYVYSLPLIHGIGHVHVCYPAFSLGTDDERAATLVHEMSHYAVGTDDKAYEWQTQKWNNMSQSDQMDNADNYGGFAQFACVGQ